MTRLAMFVVALLVSAIAGWAWMTARTPIAGNPGPAASLQEFALTVDFGVLRQGQSATHCCWLRNDSDQPMSLHHFRATCDCLTVSTVDGLLAPGGKALLELQYHGERDMEFTGALAVKVVAESPSNAKLATITASVEVIPSLPEFAKRSFDE